VKESVAHDATAPSLANQGTKWNHESESQMVSGESLNFEIKFEKDVSLAETT
jgi:hypothetical protein